MYENAVSLNSAVTMKNTETAAEPHTAAVGILCERGDGSIEFLFVPETAVDPDARIA